MDEECSDPNRKSLRENVGLILYKKEEMICDYLTDLLTNDVIENNSTIHNTIKLEHHISKVVGKSEDSFATKEENIHDIDDEFEIHDIIVKEEPQMCEIIANYTIENYLCSDNEESTENELRKQSENECPACCKLFSNIPLLRKHILEKHTTGKVCLICNENFEGDKWRHCKSHVRLAFECTICSIKLLTAASLIRHKRNHTTGRHHKCNICHKAFKTKDNLICHKLSHSEDRQFKCPLCSASFKRKCSIPKHLKIHKEAERMSEKHYKCLECDIICRSKSSLKRHKTKIHQILDLCNYCSMQFDDKQRLRKHEMQHTGNYHLQCDICSFISPSRVALVRHKRKHTGETPFRCEICSRSFKHKHNLQVHLDRVHKYLTTKHNTRKQSFQCDICLKVLSTLKYLKSHKIRFHSAENSFKCEICSEIVATKSNLANHMSLHTSNNQYSFKCTKCKQEFRYSSSLRRHEKQTCTAK